jgi:presenilin-like A22 family membrane protease
MYLPRWTRRIVAIPETNLFLFAFLIHFVYEVRQAPYFDFYEMPSLADKVNYINHCTVGDGIITVICYWILSLLRRDQRWIFKPTWKLTILFTGLAWIYTFFSEIYRVQVAKVYGVSVLVVPGLGISWLPLIQWVILPPITLFLARRHILGYNQQ